MTGDFRSVTREKPAVTHRKVDRFGLTVVTSIPLLLSFNIKYAGFPQGLPYVFLYFGGLLSVFVTPALVLLGLVTTIRIWLSSEGSNKTSLSLAGIH